MRRLVKPTFDTQVVYTLCISKVKRVALRDTLNALTPTIVASGVDYEAAAVAATLNTISPVYGMSGLTNDEINKVYTTRMAKIGAPGRPVYDAIFVSSKTCPLCGHGKVTTVDHHLPKAHHPGLCVLPVNLIPACADCNKLKGDTLMTSPSDQTIHPYFDDFDSQQWLIATVDQPLRTFCFSVRKPLTWTQLKFDRAVHHFEVFRLNSLYSIHAIEELRDSLHILKKLFVAGGAQAVQTHFQDTAASCRANRLNSWKTAMYFALASSQWICAGGFDEMAE